MQMVITIVKDYRVVEELLLTYIDIDVTGATVIEGHGMGQLLADIPILAGLRGLFPGAGENSYVTLALVNEDRVDACFSAIDEVIGDLTVSGNGIAFSVPVGRVKGLKPSIR